MTTAAAIDRIVHHSVILDESLKLPDGGREESVENNDGDCAGGKRRTRGNPYQAHGLSTVCLETAFGFPTLPTGRTTDSFGSQREF